MSNDIIITEIEKAKTAGCFLAELALALTIPSVCSFYDETLKSQNESQRYSQWYDKYVYPKYRGLTGKECYALRCEILHHGNVDLYRQKVMKGEKCANRYRLMIPDYGSVFLLNYDGEDKPFCAAGLSINILEGYEQFKSENPGFEYPLSSYIPHSNEI